MVVTTATEAHQHSLSSLDVVNVPSPVRKVQLRAVIQIPQVLETNRRKPGVDGALHTADPSSIVHTTYKDVLPQPRVQVTRSIHISWCSPREAAAPELLKSLLQS